LQIGSILIAPLIKRLPTRTVLSAAVFIFGLISCILLICDAATGGKVKMANGGKTKYGSWNPNGLFPIYIISGISYGMVELIRRVIPRDIVGGDVQKLRKMDAIVHVMYEVAGTTGAFTSTSLIGKLGYNYSSIPSPILFCTAGIVWRFVSDHKKNDHALVDEPGLSGLEKEDSKHGYMHAIWVGFRSFGKSFYFGALLVCSSRKYIWLVPGELQRD
jgi:MFS family permease